MHAAESTSPGNHSGAKTRVGGFELAGDNCIGAREAATWNCTWEISGAATTRAVASTKYPLTDALGSVYPLSDALGSVYATTDSAGAVAHRYDYDVWGVPSDLGGSGPEVDFGYTGQRHDANGLIDHGQRQRNPRLGVWLQKDRIALLQRYWFANDQPSSATDSTGDSIDFSMGGPPYTTWSGSLKTSASFLRVAYDELLETNVGLQLVARLGVADQATQVREGKIAQTPGKITTGITVGAGALASCGLVRGVVITIDPSAFDHLVQNDLKPPRGPLHLPGGVLIHELAHAYGFAQAWPYIWLPPGSSESATAPTPEGADIAQNYNAIMKANCYVGCFTPCEAESAFYSEFDPERSPPVCSHKDEYCEAVCSNLK